MPADLLLISAILLCGGAMVQAIIGFGMGVVTIPILFWLGWPIEHAVCLLVPSVFIQTLFNCLQNNVEIPWRDVWYGFVPRLLCLPIGILCLHAFLAQDKQTAEQGLGWAILVVLLFQVCSRSQKEPISSFWLIPIAMASGFLAGLLGMGGPLLVFWVTRQDWNVQRQRNFLWLSFLLIVPIQGLMMWIQFGHAMGSTFFWGTLSFPAVLGGAWLGNRIGNRLSTKNLRTLMYGFLLLVAIRLIIKGWFF